MIAEQSANFNNNKGNSYQSITQSDIQGIKLEQPVKSVQTASFESGRIKVYRLNFGKTGRSKKLRVWLRMFSVIAQVRKADVVHCHDVFFWYLPFRFLFPTKKIFTTFHGYETKFPPTPGAVIIRKVSELLSNGNICVGKYIEKWYGTKADFVTYGGVDSSIQYGVSSIQKKKNTSILNTQYRILFLGRLAEDNGVKIYLEALRKLKDRGFSFTFVACGDGKMRKKVEKWGKVMGFMPNPAELISQADIVFASSYLSILEAVAAKKPVFAVYTNVLKRDYLKMSPFVDFVNISGSAEDLAVKFASLKTDKQAVNKGYAWARKQTWDTVADMYLKLWGGLSDSEGARLRVKRDSGGDN